MAMTSSAFGWDRSVQMSSGNKYLLILIAAKNIAFGGLSSLKFPFLFNKPVALSLVSPMLANL